MSLIVVTGQPGAGKTALVVDMIAHDEQFKGRPLFVMGIPDLAVEHVPCPPVAEWTEYRTSPEDDSVQLAYFTFPENALVVLDEAQRIYRPRSAGSKVPPEVAAFETHRHLGIDFILLTQHPGLIDSNIRKLVGKHIHIRVTPFGRKRYEWTELGDPESSSSRELAASESYKLPKKAFGLYKSAQLHTKIKVKLPWYFWMFAFCLVACIGLGWYAWSRVNARMSGPDPMLQTTKDTGAKSTATGFVPKPKTRDEMLMEFVPQVPGRPETAPAFDGLRQVKNMPVVVGCIQTAKRCTCTNQQGTDAGLDNLQCKQWIANPPFDAYTDRQAVMPIDASKGRAVDPVAAPLVRPVRASGEAAQGVVTDRS